MVPQASCSIADGEARNRGQILDLQLSGRVSARRKNVKRYKKKPRVSAASAHNRKVKKT